MRIRKQEGYQRGKPKIKKVMFDVKGMISLYLEDGRIISAPLGKYPSIKKLTHEQRKQLNIANDQILIFRDCDEIYHLQDFLGREQDYAYAG